MGLEEYRESSGTGAYSEAFVVLDLATMRRTEIASHDLSAATFRGGGGAPRRPIGRLVLGPEHVAYTRLTEGSGGSVTGEMYVAPLDNVTSARKVASSSEWIAPAGIDRGRLVYVVGSKAEDELRVLDLSSGDDRGLTRVPVGDTAIKRPFLSDVAVSGDWALWLEDPEAGSPSVQGVNITNGQTRLVATLAGNCGRISASARYFAWWCLTGPGAVTATVVDAATLTVANVLPPRVGNDLTASGDGLTWTEPTSSGQRVTYFRPSPE